MTLAEWAVVAAFGAGVGCGVWLIVMSLVPSRPRLSAVLAAARSSLAPTAGLGDDDGDTADARWGGFDGLGRVAGLMRRLVVPFMRRLRRAGLPSARVLADLRVTGQPPVVHLAIVTATTLAGLTVPALLSILLAVVDLGWPPSWTWLAGAAVGFLLPTARIHETAQRRREELRRATGSVLDLTSIALAGGAGIEQALHGAAAIGTGWAADRIRAVLDAARTTRTDPWTALGRLGTELGVDELAELAATLHLAGTEGARVRASLTSKAQSLRLRQQTRDQAATASRTERMVLPVAVLAAGFLVIIGYPALSNILTHL